ncbi:acyltransferase family protein [Flavobacterium commune]|uniref:Acyltransferase 3 domain-containing protein n=1 Tax=Flavobacterium commune TaxID=1306519 RepID=A0A1D9P7P7_9FLAO|nr:acyltransferase [Flavobacterium commune]AOZ98552.1 hypothetical protein BIW12_03385 [Flavobacterium commune]
MKQERGRIAILDGFRALAIFFVMLCHFFSRYIKPYHKEDLYPYGADYDYFSYGFLGVQFFFIISGFVIFFTLENTLNFSTFWKKRLIRLFPSMLVASIIIYLFFNFFEDSNFLLSHRLLNFIPSLTFIKPELINNLVESTFGIQLNLDYLNGSYWSLWVEIQFYLFASLFFFCDKLNFIRNIIIISAFLCISNLVMYNIGGSNILGISYAKEITFYFTKWIAGGFNLLDYLPFFVIGMLFYLMFKNKDENKKNTIFVKGALLFFMSFVLFFSRDNIVRLLLMLMFFLFFVFIYYPNRLKVLQNSFFKKNGEASYFMYLIHENIGVFLIIVFGSFFKSFGFVLPLLIILFFSYLSILYYKYDTRINRFFKIKLLKE